MRNALVLLFAVALLAACQSDPTAPDARSGVCASRDPQCPTFKAPAR